MKPPSGTGAAQPIGLCNTTLYVAFQEYDIFSAADRPLTIDI